MGIARMTYLDRHRGNGVYLFRRGIPKELRDIIGKGREWRESLKTRDLAEAKSRVMEVAARVEAVFRAAREQLQEKPPAFNMAAMTALIRAWRDREIHRRGQLYLNDFKAFFNDEGEFTKECQLVGACGLPPPWILGWNEPLQVQAEAILQEANIVLPRDHAVWVPIRRLVQAAWKEVLEEVHKWRGWTIPSLPTLPPLPATATTQPILSAAPPKGPTVMEVRARYVAETVLAATFLAEQERVMRRFCEVIGGDLPVRSVTKAHVVAFKDAMLQAPRVVTAQADRALSFPALVKKYAGTDVPRMKVESVRKHLTCVHTLFAFAIKNDHVDANPVDGTIPDAPKHRVGPPRIVFAADDLRLMFTSDFAVLRDEDYWLPLLGLWTGCRLEELGQLHRSDLKWEGDVPYLDITTLSDDTGAAQKSIKTASSHRQVPLHPKLVELGFPRYVQEHPGREPRIFRNLTPNKYGRLTPPYSKRFAKRLDRLGITDARKTYHSFRHTFKARCRVARIAEEVHDALTGHSSGIERRVGRGYGQGFDVSFLYEEICKITMPGFPL